MNFLPVEKQQSIIKSLAAGMSMHKIAETEGISRNTVRKYMRNPNPKRQKITDTQIIDIKKLYNEGISLKKIAKLTGVSISSVERYTGRRRRYTKQGIGMPNSEEWGTPQIPKCQLTIKDCKDCRQIFEESCILGHRV